MYAFSTTSARSPHTFIKLKIVHCTLIFITILSIGIGIVVLQSLINEAERINYGIGIATSFIDRNISDAGKAASNVLEHGSADCKKSLPFINRTILETTSIMSISLLLNNKIVCSSFEPNIGRTVQSAKIEGLTLLESKYTVPGKPILILGVSDNEFQSIVTIHAPNILSVIQLFYPNSTFKVNVNDKSIGMDLKLASTKHDFDFIAQSESYPFNITATLNRKVTIRNALTRSWMVVFIIVSLAIVMSVLYYIFGHKVVMYAAIKQGLRRGQFKPFAQAIVDTTGKFTGCEILMRWESKGKLISPDNFIPAAEESRLIVPMTLKLISDVHKSCLENNIANKTPLYLSINICPIQLSKANSPALIEACKLFTDDHQLQHVTIVLEITERQIINNDPDTLLAVGKLLDLGVKLAIDDFGTGYSCLENIKDFKVSALKIDKCFIDHYPNDEHCFNLVSNILDLSKRLRIPIIAEGVETQKQADALVLNGVTNLQGYLYHKPVPLRQFLENRP